jgi:chromate reductase, NAD(P)H dehydrogenase (quinone)
MNTTRRILAISGSLRRASHNRALLAETQRVADGIVVWDNYEDLALLPAYNEDLEADPGEAVLAFRQSVRSADGILIATPEYNGSIPGVLKNAIDWASRPFGAAALVGKPVAVIGASTGQFGAAWAQADLRKSLGIAAARVLAAEFALAKAQQAFDADGQLDPTTGETLRGIVGHLIDLVDEAEREAAEDAEAA